jgi:uncharacterized membrane protein YfcA
LQASIPLLFAGLLIGFIGTLIGAGGGFILVPLLLLFYPEFTPEMITAISMAVVCANAISGSVAYARSGRIDYKAGIRFALFTIPGSIAGVAIVEYVSGKLFNILFGILMLVLSGYLIFKKEQKNDITVSDADNKKLVHRTITDKSGVVYTYSFRELYGNIISIIVGFISPVLGIGGGIIHVPAMTNWLKFPVHIATATSHFILAIMATVTVITHACKGTYNDPAVLNLVIFLALGVIPGAQIGAYYSHKLKSNVIIKALAFCLGLVGLRIILQHF